MIVLNIALINDFIMKWISNSTTKPHCIFIYLFRQYFSQYIPFDLAHS